MNDINFEDIKELTKDYYETINAIYKLNARTDEEIERIYKDIKFILIKTKLYTPSQILTMLSQAGICNNRYFKSY